jgi:hypothetical protein
MRMKKLAVVLAVVGVLGMSTVKSEAALAWYTCDITSVAVYSSGLVYFQVNDVGASFTGKWVLVPSDTTLGNRMLACALTGLSSGFQVSIYIDSSQLYPSLVSMYLVP